MVRLVSVLEVRLVFCISYIWLSVLQDRGGYVFVCEFGSMLKNVPASSCILNVVLVFLSEQMVIEVLKNKRSIEGKDSHFHMIISFSPFSSLLIDPCVPLCV